MPGLFGIVPLFSAPAETESADRTFAALAKSLKTHREDSLESWKILDGRLIVGRVGRPVHRFKRHPPHRDSDGSFSVAACSMAEVALAPGGRLESTHPYAFFSQVVWEAETRTFSVTVDKCASFPVFFKATAHEPFASLSRQNHGKRQARLGSVPGSDRMEHFPAECPDFGIEAKRRNLRCLDKAMF